MRKLHSHFYNSVLHLNSTVYMHVESFSFFSCLLIHFPCFALNGTVNYLSCISLTCKSVNKNRTPSWSLPCALTDPYVLEKYLIKMKEHEFYLQASRLPLFPLTLRRVRRKEFVQPSLGVPANQSGVLYDVVSSSKSPRHSSNNFNL